MTQVVLKYKNDDDVVAELVGSVRVEVDAAGGIISQSFHPEALIGVEYLVEKPAKAESKAAAKKSAKKAAAKKSAKKSAKK